MKKLGGKQYRSVRLRGLRRMTAGLVHHRAPVFSPCGRWLCLEVGEGGDSAWLICDHKGRPARILPGPAEGGASFAPDGSLAYGRRVGASLEIWQLDSGGKDPHLLLGKDGRYYRDPAYSPDGRWLCFAADAAEAGAEQDEAGKGRMRLFLLHLQSGARTALPVPVESPESPGTGPDDRAGPVQLGRPAFSPGSDCLYCEASAGDDVAVYVLPLGGPMEAPAPGLRRLTEKGVRCRRPAPLSRRLVVVEREDEDGSSELWLLDHGHDDGEVRGRRLTEGESAAREPAVGVRKGEVHLACAMLSVPEDGDVPRYDLHLAEIRGLPDLADEDDRGEAVGR
jgi:hypothetical protein